MPARAGLFVLARLFPGAELREDEERAVRRLKEVGGVLVAPGGGFRVKEVGGVRVTFAVEEAGLEEGLLRIGKCLG